MPCYDSRNEKDYSNPAEGILSKNEYAAVLCGVLRAYGIELLEDIGERDLVVGVPLRKVSRWWFYHREMDRQKRETRVASPNESPLGPDIDD